MGTQSHPGTDSAHALTGVNYLELTFALLGGALAWFLRLIVGSALVPLVCATGRTWTLWATTGIAAAIGVASLLAALRFRRRADSGDNSSHVGAAGWVGLVGVMMNVVALSGIIFEAASFILLPVCSRGL